MFKIRNIVALFVLVSSSGFGQILKLDYRGSIPQISTTNLEVQGDVSSLYWEVYAVGNGLDQAIFGGKNNYVFKDGRVVKKENVDFRETCFLPL